MSHELITLEAEYEQESEYVVTTGDIIEWRHSAEPATPRSGPATPPSASSAEKPRYLTRRLLGRGGMGEVRLCKDFRIGRSVAMKVLHPEARMDLTAQLRFVQEAQIQGQLEHPAIPPVYDLGMQPDGTLFFTMKRLRGRTLAEILRYLREGRRDVAEKFPLQRLLDAFLTVCRAIEYAHTRGIIHRDLKPQNIMLGDFGEVYVLDWGIAKILDSDDDEDGVPLALRSAEAAVRPSVGRPPTAPHSVLGTLAYAAPEQMAAGQPVDARTDEFALGAILFELLTWQRARPTAAPEEMMKAIQQTPDARSSLRVPVQAVPPELVAIYERAMEHNPDERYASVGAMILDLERFMSSDKVPDLLRELARQQQRIEQEFMAHASTEPMANRPRPVPASALAETESAPAWSAVPAASPRRPEKPAAVHAAIEPPGPLPREVTQALIGDALRREQGRLRTVAVVGVALVFLALLAVTMRVRDWSLVGALCLAGVTCSGLRIWNLVDPESRRLPYAAHAASLIFFALLGRVFGSLPFLALPVALDTSLHAGSPLRGFRRFAILSSCALLLGMVGLEWLGLVDASSLFQGGSMMLMPNVVELTPGATGGVLLILSLMTVAVPALTFSQRAALLSEHERQLKLTEWQLAQTLPHEALLQTSRESRRRLG